MDNSKKIVTKRQLYRRAEAAAQMKIDEIRTSQKTVVSKNEKITSLPSPQIQLPKTILVEPIQNCDNLSEFNSNNNNQFRDEFDEFDSYSENSFVECNPEISKDNQNNHNELEQT